MYKGVQRLIYRSMPFLFIAVFPDADQTKGKGGRVEVC